MGSPRRAYHHGALDRRRMLATGDDPGDCAGGASLDPLLAPRSVAVVGASERPGSSGCQVLCNILEGGFTGTVHAVNPRHASVLGVPCVPSPAELPMAPDLAVVAVPQRHIPGVVRACGERGVGAVLLLSGGGGEAGTASKELHDEVLETADAYGMRLLGPNCAGVVNTDPAVRLDATFAVLPMQSGELGLFSQSGGIGMALIVAAARVGLGVSQFVSGGITADVSVNDMLLHWEHDPNTRVIGVYADQLGDPSTFARIARSVARCKPILALHSGTADEADLEALFRSAGVLRMATIHDLLDAARVLTGQPLPAGPRVAIIGDSGGLGILAAQAAEAAGLTVAELDGATQAVLRSFVPSAPSTQNPVDLGAGVAPGQVGNALDVLLASAQIDAILTVFSESEESDTAAALRAVIGAAAASSDKPIVATQVGAEAGSVALAGATRSLPVFMFPEAAAAALGTAYRYAQILAEPLLSLSPPATARVASPGDLV
ncbi:MAG: acetate--CoA ligase family protein [Jatrophihabitantaceae bacterium]